MQQRFPIIVELLGPSGSGKTTILRAAQPELSRRGWLSSLSVDDGDDAPPSLFGRRNALDAAAFREFVHHCLGVAAVADWQPSQALAALGLLKESCRRVLLAHNRQDPRPLLHDELLLHRAFSVLPRSANWERDTARFFELAPLPTAAVVVRADVPTNRERLAGRPRKNIHHDLSSDGLDEVLVRSQTIAEHAAALLRERGLPVLELDSRQPPPDAAQALLAFLDEIQSALQREPADAFLRRAVIAVSGNFHTRGRRHVMRTQGVAYASFALPGMVIAPADAQRDTAQRLAQFGIVEADIRDRRVLDIGCNTGALLFELSRLGPAGALGLEIDADKIAVATQIRNHLGLYRLHFETCDIEHLPPGALPAFDVVFALAVEGHVKDKRRFYELLGRATQDRLYFEANDGADIADVVNRLEANGFGDIQDLGLCVDDRDPANRRRRLLRARRLAP